MQVRIILSLDFKTNLVRLSGNYFVRLPVHYCKDRPVNSNSFTLYGIKDEFNKSEVVISLELLLITVDMDYTYCTHRMKHHSCTLKMSECLYHQTRALLNVTKGDVFSEVHAEIFSQKMLQKH